MFERRERNDEEEGAVNDVLLESPPEENECDKCSHGTPLTHT